MFFLIKTHIVENIDLDLFEKNVKLSSHSPRPPMNFPCWFSISKSLLLLNFHEHFQDACTTHSMNVCLGSRMTKPQNISCELE